MIHGAALILYIIAFLLWVRFLWKGSRGRPAGAMTVALAGVAVHGTALAVFVGRHGELPLVGVGPAFSSMAFVGGLLLGAVLPSRELARVGIVILPVIVLLQGVGVAAGVRPVPAAPVFEGAGFVLHVVLAFVGYQALVLAFAAGLLYLVQFHFLKVKRVGRVFHFIPSLEILDRLGRVAVWLGFAALTLSVVTGWAWTVAFRGSLEMDDPKVIWAVVSWVILGAVLVTRRVGARPGHGGALAAVLGFLAVASLYLILRVTTGTGGLFL